MSQKQNYNETNMVANVDKWVGMFNCFPLDMFGLLRDTCVNSHKMNQIEEITTPVVGSYVTIKNFPTKDCYGYHYNNRCVFDQGFIVDIHETNKNSYRYIVECESSDGIGSIQFDISLNDMRFEQKANIDNHGVIWSFKDVNDIEWIEKDMMIETVSQLGFRIFKHSTWGYFFYFPQSKLYEYYPYNAETNLKRYMNRFWIPLYQARFGKDKKVEEQGEKPYIHGKYNPKYGDNRMCICGHPYVRHFDSYDDMDSCGCKYCCCNHFKEKREED